MCKYVNTVPPILSKYWHTNTSQHASIYKVHISLKFKLI